MNTFRKISVKTVAAMTLGALVLGYTAASATAATPFTAALPDITQVAAQLASQMAKQIGEQISAELKATFAQLASAPRPVRGARAASVFITESNAVVVEATRLPRLDSVADADRVESSARASL
jgi:hypothetical protein